ncbi:MAG: enoyl-CoA hydratase/isomerase family protein [Myxococcota bacterium]
MPELLETLRYEERGDVATVWLLRPLLNMQMVRELTGVCDHLEDESGCKVVVFRGTDGRFSQGIDFEEFRPDKPMDIHGFNKWEKVCVRIERLPKITVAALEGAVIGGGMQLALVCDARLAAGDLQMQLNEVRLGFLPGMATFRLAKYVGLGHAKRIIMQCPVLSAEEALRLGLIDEVVGAGSRDDLDAAVAATIARFRPIHPVTVALARRLLNECYAAEFEDAIGHFLAAQHRAVSQTAFRKTVQQHQPDRDQKD